MKQNDTKSLTENYGVVAILDALGISTRLIQGSRYFIEARDKIIESMADETKKLQETWEYEMPELRTFGDTVLFAWKFPDRKPTTAIAGASQWLRGFVACGVSMGILFRGAMSVGSFIIGEGSGLRLTLACDKGLIIKFISQKT